MSPVMIDSIVAIVMILSALFAFFRGFVREMLTIVNLAGSALAAYWFAPQLQGTTDSWFGVDRADEGAKTADKIWGMIPPEMMSSFSSYAIVFFGVFLILTLAGLYISGTIKALGLGPVDKILGLVFGALRGFLIVFLVYLPFGYFMNPEDFPAWAKESVAVEVLQKAYVWGDENFRNNEDLNEDLKETGDELKERAMRARDAAREAGEDMREAGEAARDDIGAAQENLKDRLDDGADEIRNVTDDILTDRDRAEPPRR